MGTRTQIRGQTYSVTRGSLTELHKGGDSTGTRVDAGLGEGDMSLKYRFSHL